MSDAIPTIKIKHDGPKGFRIINRSAFNPEMHEAFEEASKPAQTDGEDKSATGLAVKHKGRGKFEVLDASGAVLHEGLTKEEAEAIIAG